MSFVYKYRYVIGTTLLAGVLVGVWLTTKGKGVRGSRLKNPMPKKILFVGDSVTAILDKNGRAITSTYPNYVIKGLQGKNISVDVVAKGGEATSWMKKELEKKLAQQKYDRVYVYGGINDAWNNSIKPETTLKNIEDMIDIINKNGGDAFIIQGYNPVGFMDYNKMPITRYQTSKSDNIPLIKEYQQYQIDLGKLNKSRNDFVLLDKFELGQRTGDGIHPTTEGQKMIADFILKTIR